jgi:hypothetical protein
VAPSKKNDPQFAQTKKRFRCERCVGEICEEVVMKTTNPHWHPRCNDCGKPMAQIDRLDRFVKPKPPKVKPHKPEMPGQMSFDGSVAS